MEFTYLIRILHPLNIKGQPTLYRSHVALIVQLGKHYSGNAKVVDSNPIQSLKILSGHFSSTVMAIVTLSVNTGKYVSSVVSAVCVVIK